MKVYYLSDGNEIKDFIIECADFKEECVEIFEKRARKRSGVEHSWLTQHIVTIDLEGEVSNVIDVLYTVTLNNRPVRAIINPSIEDKANLFEYYIENSNDYRKLKIIKNTIMTVGA